MITIIITIMITIIILVIITIIMIIIINIIMIITIVFHHLPGRQHRHSLVDRYEDGLLVSHVEHQAGLDAEREERHEVGGNVEQRGDLVVPGQHLGQHLAEHAGPDDGLDDHDPPVLGVDQQPLEVQLVDELDQGVVQVVRGPKVKIGQ